MPWLYFASVVVQEEAVGAFIFSWKYYMKLMMIVEEIDVNLMQCYETVKSSNERWKRHTNETLSAAKLASSGTYFFRNVFQKSDSRVESVVSKIWRHSKICNGAFSIHCVLKRNGWRDQVLGGRPCHCHITINITLDWVKSVGWQKSSRGVGGGWTKQDVFVGGWNANKAWSLLAIFGFNYRLLLLLYSYCMTWC